MRSGLKACKSCYGRGVIRVQSRYQKCHCGRYPDAVGSAQLAKQAELDKRYEEVKKTGKW